MKTVDQIAQELLVSRNTVINLIKKGSLKAIRVGEQYRIDDYDFNEFKTASQTVSSRMNGSGAAIPPFRQPDNSGVVVPGVDADIK